MLVRTPPARPPRHRSLRAQRGPNASFGRAASSTRRTHRCMEQRRPQHPRLGCAGCCALRSPRPRTTAAACEVLLVYDVLRSVGHLYIGISSKYSSSSPSISRGVSKSAGLSSSEACGLTRSKEAPVTMSACCMVSLYHSTVTYRDSVRWPDYTKELKSL